jgi:hypothetical protein
MVITKPYRFLQIRGESVILCLLCDRYSANPNDIAARYCGFCGTWLATVVDDYQRPDEDLLPPRHSARRHDT